MKTEEYIAQLQAKGFKFSDESIGFIAFGKMYTSSSDAMVNVAIEATLKQQRHFDGSYFVALLERLKQENIVHVKKAQTFVRSFEK